MMRDNGRNRWGIGDAFVKTTTIHHSGFLALPHPLVIHTQHTHRRPAPVKTQPLWQGH